MGYFGILKYGHNKYSSTFHHSKILIIDIILKFIPFKCITAFSVSFSNFLGLRISYNVFLKCFLFIYISLGNWFSTFGESNIWTCHKTGIRPSGKTDTCIIIHNSRENIVMTFASVWLLSVPCYRSQRVWLVQSHAMTDDLGGCDGSHAWTASGSSIVGERGLKNS